MNPIMSSDLTSHGGYRLGDVVSALQKSVRRGNLDDALFWASEMHLSGYVGWCWKRLKVIATEDVGMGDPWAIVMVQACEAAFRDPAMKGQSQIKPPIGPGENKFFLFQAVTYLTKAAKDHLLIDATIHFYNGERPWREMPTHVFDSHTRKGREMGRGSDYFYDESSSITNEADYEPQLAAAYRESARTVTKRPKHLKPENQLGVGAMTTRTDRPRVVEPGPFTELMSEEGQARLQEELDDGE